MLNISYNTTRLNKIIDDYKNKLEFEETRKKQLRGKPFDISEIRYTILNYLKGDSLSALAKTQFRSVNKVKEVLEKYKIPERDTSNDYWHPTMIPDESIAENFENRELVWSARYNCVAQIMHTVDDSTEHGKIYSIWVFGKHNEKAMQPWYELGKLDILKELGVTDKDFDDYQTQGLFYSIR